MTLHSIIPLDHDRAAVRTLWGGWVVVPLFNVDVALGVLRDGQIEPWTTRLVQEMLRPGDVYLNAGANFGYYLSLAGGIVGESGRVHGVEPNPYIFRYLIDTMYWAGLPNRASLNMRALAEVEGRELDFSFDPPFLGRGAPIGLLTSKVPGSRAPLAPVPFDPRPWNLDLLPLRLDENGAFDQYVAVPVNFKATTTTIDRVLANEPQVALIHLDIEGSEPLALAGAAKTIARSDGIRLITEWAAGHYQNGSPTARRCFDETWQMLSALGFRVRQLMPRLAPDGGIFVSGPLDFETMTTSAQHGDYVWLRPSQDPWGE